MLTVAAVAVDFHPLAPATFVNAITVGPDQKLWFTEDVFNSSTTFKPAIGVIDPTTKAIREFPTSGVAIGGLASDGGSKVYFLEIGPSKIGVIDTTTGAIADYPVSLSGSSPAQITVDRAGTPWFTDPGLNMVGSFNPTTHAFTEYPLPTPRANPAGITLGPDGKLWFAESAFNAPGAIGVIDPGSHAISEYPISNAATYFPLGGIVAGPDGNLWYTEQGAGSSRPHSFGTINPTTHAVSHYTTGDTNYVGTGIHVGPDGALWSGLVEMDASSKAVNVVQALVFARAGNSNIGGQVTGPNGHVWAAGQGGIQELRALAPNETLAGGTVLLDPSEIGAGRGAVPGRTVFVDLNGNGKLDAGEPTAVTDASGDYTFTNLAPGTYTFRVATLPGEFVTVPGGDGSQTLSVAGGQIASPSFRVVATATALPLSPSATPFGTSNSDVATAEVVGLYHLILGRNPDAPGLADWAASVRNGLSIGEVAVAFFNSKEYLTKVARQDYRTYLGREASSVDVTNVVAALQRGALTEEGLAAGLMSSAEFNKNHQSNASFITAAYEDILGRDPDAAKIAQISGFLDRGVLRSDIIASLMGSGEARFKAVTGLYATFTQHVGDPYPFSQFQQLLVNGYSLKQIAPSFANLRAYAALAAATVPGH